MQQINQEDMDMEMANTSTSAGKKESKGMMMGMIMCSVLAIVGIGFGVYGMTRKPEEKPAGDIANAELETELSNIKQKYAVLQDYIKKLEASGTETPEEAKSASESRSTNDIEYADNRYIYINDWGIKIKLPEELSLVTYSYDYGDNTVNEAGDNASLCISGSEDNSLYAFSSVRKAGPGLVCITRNSRQREHLVDAVEIFHNDSGWYYLSGAQAFRTEENTMARSYEINIMDLFNKHFSDPSNYSAI
ncbi:hypothetical protein IKG31_00765 [Candidatus Saccharibacteria bacterium]|nr:hypothetical protein [Candidatus Saccharibacteria bacterium]